jgi:hypothetical protein
MGTQLPLTETTMPIRRPCLDCRIRLRDTNRSFTPKQYELAQAILDNFPDIKPGIRKKATRVFRKQVRHAGIKYDTADLRPALDAIFLSRLRDPLEP